MHTVNEIASPPPPNPPYIWGQKRLKWNHQGYVRKSCFMIWLNWPLFCTVSRTQRWTLAVPPGKKNTWNKMSVLQLIQNTCLVNDYDVKYWALFLYAKKTKQNKTKSKGNESPTRLSFFAGSLLLNGQWWCVKYFAKILNKQKKNHCF